MDALKGLRSIEKDSVHLIITSPPYNLGIDYGKYEDNRDNADYLTWMNTIWEECNRVLCNGGRLCINIGENKRTTIEIPPFCAFINQCVQLDMFYRGTIIWDKNSAAKHTAWGSWKSPSNPHLVPRHEYILVFSKGSYKLTGGKGDMTSEEFMLYTRTVWKFGTESKKKIGHPAPFPVELPRRLIKFYSYQDQTVLDPFAGSGTVGVACVELKRKYILIEHSEDYCEISKKRIFDAGRVQGPGGVVRVCKDVKLPESERTKLLL